MFILLPNKKSVLDVKTNQKKPFFRSASLASSVSILMCVVLAGCNGSSSKNKSTAYTTNLNQTLQEISDKIFPNTDNSSNISITLNRTQSTLQNSNTVLIATLKNNTTNALIYASTDEEGKGIEDTLHIGKTSLIQITLPETLLKNSGLTTEQFDTLIQLVETDLKTHKNLPLIESCNTQGNQSSLALRCVGDRLEGVTVLSGGGQSTLRKESTARNYLASIARSINTSSAEPVELIITSQNGVISEPLNVAMLPAIATTDEEIIAILTTTTPTENEKDSDNDNVPDSIDNCPTITNSQQSDTDKDGIGDVCDSTDNPPTAKDIIETIAYGKVLTIDLAHHANIFDEGGVDQLIFSNPVLLEGSATTLISNKILRITPDNSVTVENNIQVSYDVADLHGNKINAKVILTVQKKVTETTNTGGGLLPPPAPG